MNRPGFLHNANGAYLLARVCIDRATSCWEWQGSMGDHGYGLAHFDKTRTLAHRAMWQHFYGPIPEGMCCCHTCDNRSCVNPSHIFIGTRADNLADMTAKGRRICGEASPKAKLSSTQVLTIRLDYALGRATRAELSSRFRISPSQINRIINGKNWVNKHSAADERS